MHWFRHLVFAAIYVALALVVALTLPLSVAGMDGHTALLFGIAILLFGGLLHEFWARQEQRNLLEARIWDLEAEMEELRLELNARPGPAVPPPADPPLVATMLSEARVLERLADRLPQPAARPSPALDAGPLFAPRTPDGPTTDTSAILDQVRVALRTDHVDIFLQPVVSLPQRKHRYYELFSRIKAGADGDGKPHYLLPEQYLGVAAEAGLMATIDNLLLFRCIQLLRETEKRHQNVGFFCNISAATLNDAAFMREFVPYMGQSPNLSTKLVFELSQSDLMQGGLFVTGFLDGLRRLGFHFSMDQVDSLDDIDWNELARHEIRFVKLDAARLLDPGSRFADPRAVRDLRQQLDRNNIDLIVEKVETEAQLLELLDLYIDFGQGYLFGEPRLAKKQPTA